MRVTVVNQSRGNYFGIHKVGCRDVERDPGNGFWQAEGDTLDDIIASEVEGLNADGLDYDASSFDIYPCCKNTNRQTNRPKEVNMSTQTINRTKKINAKTTAKRATVRKPAKTATKVTPAKAQKSLTVNFIEKGAKKHSVRFDEQGKERAVGSIYLRNSAVALLDEQNTITLQFETDKSKPVTPGGAMRFTEKGKEVAIGTLYFRQGAKLGITENKGIKLTVTVSKTAKGIKVVIAA